MADIQPPPTYADVVLIDSQTKLPKFNPIWLKWFLDLAQVFNEAGGTTIDHNVLANLQGGTANQFYHLTSAEATSFTGVKSANTVLAGPASGAAAVAAFRALVTADLANQLVTFAKIQNITDMRLLGRSAGSAGAPMEISVAARLALAAGVLDLAAAQVTVAYMLASATDVLFGRSTAGAGVGEEVPCTATGRAAIAAANAAALATVAGLGSGLSVTVTTAALTGGGTTGSMTFTNGVLTAQVAAT